jgi:glycosyltransferase involved in cell wall biosynthesis
MVMLANGFAARGHRVDLVLARADGPYLDEVSAGVRVIDLNRPDRGRVIASLLPLARYLRRERPDAMLSALNNANIVAIWAHKLARVGTRLAVSEHAAPSQSLRGNGISLVIRRFMRLFYPWADCVVCVSKGIEDEMHRLLGIPKAKLVAIYNPVDVDGIREKAQEPVNHSWLADRTIPVVLAAGRLTRQKDYPTLLSAFARLRVGRNARLIILGQGEEEERLKTLAQELGIAGDVAFAGFQKNPFAWMARCDLYVMSSAWEGLPGTLLEAMACGAKIVSTDCRSGPDEILEGGRWGRLVPVGDAEALARAMAEALDDASPPDVRFRASAFNLDQAVDGYLKHILPNKNLMR